VQATQARTIILLLLILALFPGCATISGGAVSSDLKQILIRYPALKDKPYTTVEVKRVVDGDTFETDIGDKVRLIGVNTPETVKPNSPVEAYGKEASDYTKKRLTGQTVYMFADVGDKDKYGRLLRYVFIKGDEEMFNETLLREGYGNTMTIAPNVMFAEAFVNVEREARSRGKGLWGKDEGLQTAASSCKNPQIKGNINSKKEKIYHLPGGKSYKQTKAEMMFCTEDEALAAGFRKAG